NDRGSALRPCARNDTSSFLRPFARNDKGSGLRPCARNGTSSSATSRLLVAMALISATAACEIEKVGIPQTEQLVALHGVLSASAFSQVVLLERTRNGSVAVVGPSFELENPLGSDSGIAESGAIVTLTTPSGTTLVAKEDITELFGTGEGVYRF